MAKTAEKSAVREFRAEARFQRTSPQKAKLVLDTIKGQSVENALNTLMFTRKRIAPIVEKALRSAVQNANYLSQEQGFDLDIDRLFVKQAVANEGPRMKRIRPAPMGRAFRYQRRLAHIIVTVAEKKSVEATKQAEAPVAAAEGGKKKAAPAKKAAAKKAPAKKAASKKAAATA
ncbi:MULTISPECIES: 50S ribosomal protein L22 [Terriglobus]|jgi:large subunit ribosomal protein L22|uniref:Large ribosomal subunit protein uL22 n=1 Tax=Terriglobus roseus TaxID=392734 RepID=A0A1G7F618_9BACT|nr:MULTISPECIES: 50S ribosomal protein L22 [Terriglobus]SDE71329.1 LSU ribosomal protein L22P [Terriglobus roseus]